MIKALTIFSGSSNRELSEAICRYVEVPPGRAEVTKFSDGESYVEIGENVRGVNCFVVQSTSSPQSKSETHGQTHAEVTKWQLLSQDSVPLQAPGSVGASP